MVNYALLLICAVAFGYELSLGPELEAFIRKEAFVPAQLVAATRGDGPPLWRVGQALLVSMFLHGGWIHLVGNLLYLRVFGDNIEDRLGPLRYGLFYLAAGIAGSLAQFAVAPTSDVPMVGASGAIAGVLGAYLVLFPSARIVTLFPVFIFLTFIEVPAFVFLGLWALQQSLNGVLALEEGLGQGGGVAWFAHLGGFAVGVTVGAYLRIRRRARGRLARKP